MLQRARRELGGLEGLTVVFDCAGEGLTFFPDPHQQIAEQTAALGLQRDRTFLLTSRLRPEEAYEDWCARHGQNPLFRPLYTPVQLYFYAGVYRAAADLAFFDRLFAERSPTTASLRGRRFVCLNLMPREARWATVLRLLDEGLLEEGYVSFHGRVAAKAHGEYAHNLEEVRAQLRALDVPERLISRVEELDALTPIQLDTEGGSRFDKAYGLAEQPYWGDAYFAILTESDFPAHAGDRFTEKVLKPFANLMPFVLVGTPGALAELRRLGFMTFDGIIDERYDAIESPAERLSASLDEAMRLARMSTTELRDLYAALWPRLVHNLMHLLTMSPRLVDRDDAFRALSAIDCDKPGPLLG